MKILGTVIAGAAYVGGVVLAKGFWLTALAVILPPYGYFLVAAKLLGW
jgi:hypothetical protein